MAYATIAEVRASDPTLADTATYPDALITEAIDWATTVIDTSTKTSWEYKPFEVDVDGNNCRRLYISVLYPRTITEAEVDDVTVDATTWKLRPEGVLVRPVGEFFPWGDLNVHVEGTAGATETAPADIAWACRTIAAQYAKELTSRIPERALQLQSEFGQITLAQPGGSDRPTSLPEVNAVLRRRSEGGPTCF